MTRARGPAADRVPAARERARAGAEAEPPGAPGADAPGPGGAEEGGARRDPPWWDTNDFALIVLAAVPALGFIGYGLAPLLRTLATMVRTGTVPARVADLPLDAVGAGAAGIRPHVDGGSAELLVTLTDVPATWVRLLVIANAIGVALVVVALAAVARLALSVHGLRPATWPQVVHRSRVMRWTITAAFVWFWFVQHDPLARVLERSAQGSALLDRLPEGADILLQGSFGFGPFLTAALATWLVDLLITALDRSARAAAALRIENTELRSQTEGLV